MYRIKKITRGMDNIYYIIQKRILFFWFDHSDYPIDTLENAEKYVSYITNYKEEIVKIIK